MPAPPMPETTPITPPMIQSTRPTPIVTVAPDLALTPTLVMSVASKIEAADISTLRARPTTNGHLLSLAIPTTKNPRPRNAKTMVITPSPLRPFLLAENIEAETVAHGRTEPRATNIIAMMPTAPNTIGFVICNLSSELTCGSVTVRAGVPQLGQNFAGSKTCAPQLVQ